MSTAPCGSPTRPGSHPRQASIQASAFAGSTGAPLRDREQYQLFTEKHEKVTGALAAGIALAIPATTAASPPASAGTSGGESVKGIVVTSWGGESDG